MWTLPQGRMAYANGKDPQAADEEVVMTTVVMTTKGLGRESLRGRRDSMPKKRAVVRAAFLTALVLAFAGYPTAARAIPLFAHAQGGVSWEPCHTVPPNLNAYGRYVL